MKKFVILPALIIVALLLVLTGCEKKAEQVQADAPAAGEAHGGSAPAGAPAADPANWNGSVAETVNSGGYTYVLLDTGSERMWCAGPETSVAVGDAVTIPKGMLMPNFYSKTLDRTFEQLYFVGGIYAAGDMAQKEAPQDHIGGMPAGAAGGGAHTVLDDAEIEGVSKVAGGYTVEEMFTRGEELAGMTVKVRGRVVKFTPNIMGTNWIHLQDGTGSGDTVDLTVTTANTVAVDDLIVVEGTLACDKDFGAGYFYSAIIEKATVTKE